MSAVPRAKAALTEERIADELAYFDSWRNDGAKRAAFLEACQRAELTEADVDELAVRWLGFSVGWDRALSTAREEVLELAVRLGAGQA